MSSGVIDLRDAQFRGPLRPPRNQIGPPTQQSCQNFGALPPTLDADSDDQEALSTHIPTPRSRLEFLSSHLKNITSGIEKLIVIEAELAANFFADTGKRDGEAVARGVLAEARSGLGDQQAAEADVVKALSLISESGNRQVIDRVHLAEGLERCVEGNIPKPPHPQSSIQRTSLAFGSSLRS